MSTAEKSILSQGETYVFTPVSTAYGKFKGFGISVLQQNATGTLESVNSVDVNFVAGQVNTLPVFTSAGTALPNAVEDVPFVISYNDLATNYGGFDPETGALTYQIISLPANSSTYAKTSGGTTTPFTSGPIDINPGDTITWTPPANADAATQTIFTVKLKDGVGALSSADRTVQALVQAVNDTPIYGSPITNLADGSKNTNVTITHANVLAAIPYTC